MPRDSGSDAFTPASDYESRVTQLLDLTREQIRAAKIIAAPRLRDALTELDYILEDQIAALANAVEDDKTDADALASGDA